MDLHHLCSGIRQRVAAGLEEAADPGAKAEILFQALYELARTVLPALGVPKKTDEYRENQEAVLGLITYLVLPLIRAGDHDKRGVEVLAEIGEGCQDPLLKRKMDVYGQELLLRSLTDREKREAVRKTRINWGIGTTATVLICYLLLQAGRNCPLPEEEPGQAQVAPRAAVPKPPASPPAPAQVPNEAAVRATAEAEPRKGEAQAADVAAPALQKPVPLPGEQSTTRVRVVKNQVLVPVTLKHGGSVLHVELVLDTGATRTAIHEGVVGRLPIDLKNARTSQALVADGRMIRSRIAKVDSVAVGPFALAPTEVEIIPYHGGDGMHDGLLGMDFLGRQRYQIDMEHELIRWF